MLRWCLPTVRVSGGRGNALLRSFRSASSTAPSALELNHGARYRGFSDTSHPLNTLGRLGANEGSKLSAMHLTQDVTLPAGGRVQNPDMQGDHDDLMSLKVHHPPQNNPPPPKPSLEASISEVNPLNATGLPHHVVSFTTRNDTPEEATALAQLKNFLGPNASTPTPVSYNPSMIRSLYFSVKHRNQLRELGAEAMSSLISLFGTMSISTPDRSYHSVYTHPLATPILKQAPSRSYWSFVVQLAREKESTFQHLNVSDHYWLMRAKLVELESLGTAEHGECDAQRVSRLLNGARFHYMHIRSRCSHPEVHVPYLWALLASRSCGAVNEATKLLLDLLREQSRWHPKLVDVLWSLVLQSRPGIPLGLRRGILYTLARRSSEPKESFHTGTSHRDDMTRASLQSSTRLGYATTLVKMLTRTVTHPHTPVHGQPLQTWVHTAVQFAFPTLSSTDTTSTATAWRHLVLLALANHPDRGLDARDVLDPCTEHTNPSLQWEVICLLSVLEGLARSGNQQESAQTATDGILTALWQRWSRMVSQGGGDAHVNQFIVAAFISLANSVQDRELVDICYNFCQTFKSLEVPVTVRSHAPWLVAYLSSILPTRHDIPGLLHEVLGWLPDGNIRTSIVDALVFQYKDIDAHLTRELYRGAEMLGIHVTPETLVTWGRQLASEGQLASALTLLEASHLSSAHRWDILQKVLDHIGVYGTAECRELLRDIHGVVTELAPSFTPSPSLHRSLKYAILAIVRSSEPQHAVPMVESLLASNPSVLESSFCRKVLQQLAARRFIREAYALWRKVIQPYSMDTAGSLHNLVLAMMRAGSYKLVHHVIRDVQGRYPVLPDSLRLVKAMQFRWRRPPAVSTFQLLPWLARQKNPASTSLVLDLLLRSGRIRLAKYLFSRLPSSYTSAQRATLGNSILYAAMIHKPRRHARKLKKTLYVLGQLKQTGFEPDRVTVNILIKALLSWTRDIDTDAVRTLFDRMVRSGYPTAPDIHPDSVPFGTAPSAVVIKLPTLTSPISFEKHVRPLYKMFIKAFYVRQDLYAARKVEGILKALEVEHYQARVLKGRSVGRKVEDS